MRYPENLKNGDTIGFVAPSFGCVMEPYHTAFAHSVEKWHSLGYRTKIGPNAYADSGIGISSSPEMCGAELTDFYTDPETDALISCGGGELMCEILDYVDFDRIGHAPAKWYQGYSDNTNFTFLQTTLCDTACIYGPCAPSFGMEPWHRSLEDCLAVLRGEKDTVTGYDRYEKDSLKDEAHPLAPYNVTHPRHIRIFLPDGRGRLKEETSAEVSMQGRLAGGCTDCLVTLLGTEYDQVNAFSERYASDGIVWFLESCDLNVFSLRRAMWQMIHAGWFKHVRGFLIGRPGMNGQVIMGLDQYRAVTDLLAAFEVPVVMDLDFGHIPPAMPILCGSYGEFSAQGQEMKLTFKRV